MIKKKKRTAKPAYASTKITRMAPIIIKNKSNVMKLFEKQGIEIGEVIQYSIPNLKPYKNLARCKNSFFLSKHVINLPNEYKISKEILQKLENI